MRVKQTYNIYGYADAFFAQVQDVLVGGSFILDGDNTPNALALNNYQSEISLTSVNDLSGSTFTISGYSNGVFIEETIAGPDNETVTTNNFYSILTSVTVDSNILQCSVGNAGVAAVPIQSNLGSNSFITVGCWSISIDNPDGGNLDILGTHNYNPNAPLQDQGDFAIVTDNIDNRYVIDPTEATILDALVVQLTVGASPLTVNYISV